tara:strand:+ start:186 stop:395 length:210 start_codon:yes stop_codon:yes gene_type:complete
MKSLFSAFATAELMVFMMMSADGDCVNCSMLTADATSLPRTRSQIMRIFFAEMPKPLDFALTAIAIVRF